MVRTPFLLRRASARRVIRVTTFALTLPAAVPAQERAARPEDVASIDAIITAVYDAISGPAGQKRDWARFESLFAPGARLIPTTPAPDGSVRPRMLTPSEYAERMGGLLEERGFFENEISRVTESFGRIAHAFSTYESRWTPGAEPFQRGINSIQLLFEGERWWVVSIFWDAERPDNPIPDRYLRGRSERRARQGAETCSTGRRVEPTRLPACCTLEIAASGRPGFRGTR